jgi:hypothetical protein
VTTEAASATKPKEAAIPEATFERASASDDGFNDVGLVVVVDEEVSSSAKDVPTLSTMTELFLLGTTFGPNDAIFF